MTALDASLVIAHFEEHDKHHDAAAEFFANDAGPRWIATVTLAEVLVPHIPAGTAGLLAALDRLDVQEWPFGEGAALQLAELRALTRLKMPDCCVLLAAQQAGDAVATFDRRLRQAAGQLGIPAVP